MRYKLTFNLFKEFNTAEKFARSLGRKKHTLLPYETKDNSASYIVWYYVS